MRSERIVRLDDSMLRPEVAGGTRRHTPLSLVWLYLMILALPFYGFSFLNWGIRGVLRPDWIFAGLLVLSFVMSMIKGRSVRLGNVHYFVMFLNLAAILSYLGMAKSDDERTTSYLTLYGQILFMSVVFLAISNLEMEDRHLRSLIRLWIGIAVVVAGYSLYEVFAVNMSLPTLPFYFTNPSIKAIGTEAAILSYKRSASFLAEPGYLGAVITGPLIFMLVNVILSKDHALLFQNRASNWLLIAILAGAVVASQALSAYLVILSVVALIGMRLITRPQFAGRLLLVAAVIGGTATAVAMFGGNLKLELLESIAGRFGQAISGNDASGQVRVVGNLVALKMWMDHPLFGVGVNNFLFHVPNYVLPSWYGGWQEITTPGNMWTEALSEMGIFGFIALCGVWLASLRQLWMTAKKTKSNDWLSVALFAFFYVLVADVLSSLFLHSIAAPQLWVDLGVAYILVRHRRENTRSYQLAAGDVQPFDGDRRVRRQGMWIRDEGGKGLY